MRVHRHRTNASVHQIPGMPQYSLILVRNIMQIIIIVVGHTTFRDRIFTGSNFNIWRMVSCRGVSIFLFNYYILLVLLNVRF